MPSSLDVAIIGAGPYGLSLAAHLAARGVEHVVIGTPMAGWTEHMPKGMSLKSEGFASNLYDPDDSSTLEHYCSGQGIAYAEMGQPVTIENFIAYGIDFQRQHAPKIEREKVVRLDRAGSGYSLRLADGRLLTARRVVVATGVAPLKHVPAEIAHLPAELASHSADHNDLGVFLGRDVIVVGGGSSAVDTAAILHESGAAARLLVRSNALYIHSRSKLPRPLWQRIRHPVSTIGPSWRSIFYAEAPFAFHHMSEARRLRLVRKHLGPAGGWFMADRIAPVPTNLGTTVRSAEVEGSRVRLDLVTNGASHSITTDHVLAATGYRVDLRRYDFLGEALRARIAAVEHAPILSAEFQSSVPGLYMIGPVAANSFGPVMRFACGARFTAKRLARHLSGRRAQRPEPVEVRATGATGIAQPG